MQNKFIKLYGNANFLTVNKLVIKVLNFGIIQFSVTQNQFPISVNLLYFVLTVKSCKDFFKNFTGDSKKFAIVENLLYRCSY